MFYIKIMVPSSHSILINVYSDDICLCLIPFMVAFADKRRGQKVVEDAFSITLLKWIQPVKCYFILTHNDIHYAVRFTWYFLHCQKRLCGSQPSLIFQQSSERRLFILPWYNCIREYYILDGVIFQFTIFVPVILLSSNTWYETYNWNNMKYRKNLTRYGRTTIHTIHQMAAKIWNILLRDKCL